MAKREGKGRKEEKKKIGGEKTKKTIVNNLIFS